MSPDGHGSSAMTKTKPIAAVAVALAALVALSGLVAAGYGPAATTAADESTTQGDWDEDDLNAALDRLQERYDLTDEQVSQLRETIESELEEGAEPLEIRDAVIDQLEAFGIEDPQVTPSDDAEARNDTVPAPAFDRLQERYDLTDEQVADLRETVQSMMDDGANRTAIHEAIVEKLESFGVEDPDLGPQAAWSNGDAAGAPWGLFGFGPHASGQGSGQHGNGNGPGNGPHGHGPGNGAGNGHGGTGNATAGGGPGQGLGPGNAAGGR
jgi:regulator of replication initiation timing